MRKYFLIGMKYLFSVVLILLSFRTTKQFGYVGMSLLELGIIFIGSNFLISKSKYFCILNDLVMLIFNAETLVLLFGNKYISYLMLDNLESLEDLSGRALEYSIGVLFVLGFSILPCKSIEWINHYFIQAICTTVILETVLLANTSQAYSPSRGIYELFTQYQDYQEMNALIAAFVNADFENAESGETDRLIEKQEEQTTSLDEHSVAEISDGIKNSESANDESTNTSERKTDSQIHETASDTGKDTETEKKGQTQKENSGTAETGKKGQTQKKDSANTETDNNQSADKNTEASEEQQASNASDENIAHDIFGSSTNVILIFTEGLSKCVVTDDRAIMPNVSNFASKSLSFKNYYNHTFATYRGIQGQLYSGFQNDNFDVNHLTSMMDILKQNGYYTAMINTEPNNSDFTSYLNAMSFDAIYSDPGHTSGSAYSMNDREAYAFLYEKASELQNSGQKFFLVIYTFGTHTTLDATEQPFGDGSLSELNKFYNADYYFGDFFQKFCESVMSSNTAIVYTADHATYTDEAWGQAFPDTKRGFSDLSEIPLYIYYQGRSATYDAKGRNSLDLAPTVLDLLGLPSSEDFLGASLFSAKATSGLDTYFWEPGALLYTGNDKIESVGAEKQKSIYNKIAQYLAKK